MADPRSKASIVTSLTHHILELRKLNPYHNNISMLHISHLILTYLHININRCTIRICKIGDDTLYLPQCRLILSSINSDQHWRFPTRQGHSKPEK
jgi:hypothetical protein